MPDRGDAGPAADPVERLESVRVLHVDDEPEFLSVVARLLEDEREALSVVTETDPEAALDRVGSERVDCVVSDYDMAGTDGLELLRAVREVRPGLPFVLFTGTGSEQIASEAISAGITDYLQKGSGDQYAVLANRILNAVAKYRASQRLQRRIDQQEAVARLGQAALGTEPAGLTDLLATATDRVAEGLDAEYGQVYRHRPAEGSLVARACTGCSECGSVPADGGSHVARALREEGPVVVDDPGRFEWAAFPFEDVTDGIAVAVGEGDDPWGVVAAHGTTRRRFTDDDVTFLRSVANLLATAVDRVERERRLSTLISNLPGIVYRCRNEPDWPMEFVGGQCAEVTGYAAAELEAGEVSWGRDVIVPEDREMAWETVQEAVDGGDPFELTYRIRTADGSRRWMWERGRGIRSADGDLEALEGFITDVTERKENERRLQRERDRLDEFASVLSHDLRNPIEVANAELALARREDGDHLDRIDDALSRMSAIVDDILALARRDLDVDGDPVALADVAREAYETVRAPDATLSVEEPGRVVADRGQVRQLLSNLFRNAVEHGTADGRSSADGVRIALGPIHESGEFVGFYVADDGPGVAADDPGVVFDAGYSTDREGLGLGLSIVERIADAHGWTVEVATSEDGGARFEVRGVDRP